MERVYSVLVVSAAENFRTGLTAMLVPPLYGPVCLAGSISEAKRILAEQSFDLLIINAPLPDEMGTRFAIDVTIAGNTVVLLLVRAEMHGEIYQKVCGYGVFTLPKPVPRSMLSQALAWMISVRERLRRSEKKTLSLEEKMEEIRLVNRAKWLLITELKMTEPDAHRYMEKQAMDACVSKREIARKIIQNYS